MTVNSAQCSGWTEESILKLRWGDDFEAAYARLQALAAQVSGAVLLYDGAPAAACYHAASCGHTEASQHVWEEALQQALVLCGRLGVFCGMEGARELTGEEVTCSWGNGVLFD